MVRIYQMPLLEQEGKSKRELEKEAGRQLLMKGLAEGYGIRAEQKPAVIKGERGKPYLADFPHIHYNISHTDQLAVCGIGDVELGIDVERIRPFKESVIKRVLSEAEQRKLESLPKEKQPAYFFRFWTLKESYGKAAGCGLSMDMKDISFELEPEGNIRCSRSGVFFSQWILRKDYVLSLCTFEKTEIVHEF